MSGSQKLTLDSRVQTWAPGVFEGTRGGSRSGTRARGIQRRRTGGFRAYKRELDFEELSQT
jgi:hypothetical protein